MSDDTIAHEQGWKSGITDEDLVLRYLSDFAKMLKGSLNFGYDGATQLTVGADVARDIVELVERVEKSRAAEKSEQICHRCWGNPADYTMVQLVEEFGDEAIVYLCSDCFTQTMEKA